jgi:hypothetical protein
MSEKKDEITEFFGEVISSYTSEQAEADGILVATGNPVINYVTRTVWDKCIEPFASDGIWEKFAKNKEEYQKVLLDRLLESAIWAVKLLNRKDWLYVIRCRGWELWVSQNETGKFTLMLPEDY